MGGKLNVMLSAGIYFIELYNPGCKNALTMEMLSSLAEVMQQVQSDRDIRVVVISRIASSNAVFGITPSKLGLVYHPDGIKRFIDVIGPRAAKYLLLTGRFINAGQALTWGIVDDVVHPDELEKATARLAEELVSNAPNSLRGHKEIINNILESNEVDEKKKRDLYGIVEEALCSEDIKEGIMAFKEKRKPRFKGY